MFNENKENNLHVCLFGY